MLRERSLDTGGAELGLLMIDVSGESSSCIARRRKVDACGVMPVSMTVMNDAAEAIKRWQSGTTFWCLSQLMFMVTSFADDVPGGGCETV